MSNDTVSNIYNPAEYLKQMADEETGCDEPEPHQERVPEQLEFDFEFKKSDPNDDLRARVAILEQRFDDLCSLITRIWGAR